MGIFRSSVFRYFQQPYHFLRGALVFNCLDCLIDMVNPSRNDFQIEFLCTTPGFDWSYIYTGTCRWKPTYGIKLTPSTDGETIRATETLEWRFDRFVGEFS